MLFESFSQEDTIFMGEVLAQGAKSGEVYVLCGNLGVGKTVFAKGFAQGLGIDVPVVSPTFTILNEYHQGWLPLYHFDVYRITSADDMEDTGYEEYFYGSGVCLVEWGELVAGVIPLGSKWIRLEKDTAKGEAYRRIRMEVVL